MIFAQDVSTPEGPVVLPDGGWAVTEMDQSIINHVSVDHGATISRR